MPVHSASKIGQISQADDPKQAIIKAVGDLGKARVCNDLVLLGTYIRNEKTAGGIIRPLEAVVEDEYQGKVGLVLKPGPLAFSDWEEDDSKGANAEPFTWVVYAIKDSWPVQINGTPCRLIPYDKIRMTIPDPTMVF
jgi:hypothetical protein